MALAAQRRWIMPKKARDDPDGIPALVARVLACRGLASAEMATFLAARPTEDGPPMLDLDEAVERLRRALAARERIVVYGDYDVDGIAGSAILVRAFRQLGFVVGAYIPNRYEEGYGLNSAALRQLAQDGAKVIVSVDCGITAVKEAALARELRIDLIVTDHHHPPAELPDAYALVNPRRPGDPSIDKELAGAGVAVVLARRLLGDLAYSLRQDELLQLCALATVADVVPLRVRNRVLTRMGLEALNRAPLVGVRALVERAGRPAIVIAIDGDEGKGSCRSIAGVHIAEALDDCDDILIKHGGHAMAAGFSVSVDRIPDLTLRLDAVVRERLHGERPVPTIRVDAEIAPEILTSKLALELATLEPCGAGNQRPYLLIRDVRVYDIRQVGADADHLRCKVTVGRFTFDAMAFRRGDHAEGMTEAGRVDAVVSIGTGPRGFVELELRDFGPVGTAAEMERLARGAAPVLVG